MISRIPIIGIVAAIVLTITGCAAQQLYTTGQAWQRNECTRTLDQWERERCLSNAGTPYEAYKKQSGTTDAGK